MIGLVGRGMVGLIRKGKGRNGFEGPEGRAGGRERG